MSMISEHIKELREFCKERKHDVFSYDEVNGILLQAVDTIEFLSAKLAKENTERSERYYNGGWILCSDRLPSKEECGDFGKEFNVTVYTNELKTLTMEFVYETVRGKEVGRWKWLGRLSPWEVIAWKSLPEPYKPQ